MMAGRCISSDRPANSALRVKASCMAMGQAAATAAAQAIGSGVSVDKVSMDNVKQKLAQSGAIVPGVTDTFSFASVIKGVTNIKE